MAIDYQAEIDAIDETMAIIRRSPEGQASVEGRQWTMADLGKLSEERGRLVAALARSNRTATRVMLRRHVGGAR